jgi:uncharacterized membrane protein
MVVGVVGVLLMAPATIGWLEQEYLLVGAILFAAGVISRPPRP